MIDFQFIAQQSNGNGLMSSFAAVLKAEIVRLSRREARSQLKDTHKVLTTQRRQIAELKRRIVGLTRETGRRQRYWMPAELAIVAVDDKKRARFSAKGLHSQRARLALSAESLGKLLGVSGQTIYNWEQKKATPQAAQLASIVALRKLGKRQVAEKLAKT